MADDPECLYQLQGSVARDTWRAFGFLYCEFRAAKMDAHRYLAHFPCVRIVNKTTGQVEHIHRRI